MPQEISASIQRKLHINFILRVVLAAAIPCLWALPLLFHAIYGGPVGIGELYSMIFLDFCIISASLVGGYYALHLTQKRILSGQSVNIERKLKTNLILRVVLAVAFVAVWLAPLLFSAFVGKLITTGELYSGTFTGLLTASLPLAGGILALQFTRNRIVRESGVKGLAASPALEA